MAGEGKVNFRRLPVLLPRSSGGRLESCLLGASCLERAPGRLEAGVRGSELAMCPDHPRKVKSYCRPEVGGMESGPGNVTELHKEASLAVGHPEEKQFLQVCCR